MNTVFPVELEEVLKPSGEKIPSRMLQAFTRDVSEGGMCLELKSFGAEAEKLFSVPDAQLDLTINPAFSRHPIKAIAQIVWFKKQEDIAPPRYLIGVQYIQIDPVNRRRLIGYAQRLIWIPRITLAAVLVMGAVILALFLREQGLVRQNRALVKQLVQNAENKSSITGDLYELQKKKNALGAELTKAQGRIRTLEGSIAALEQNNLEQKNADQNELRQALAKQKTIEEELTRVREGKEKLRSAYRAMETQEKPTADSALKQMVQWIESHQNLRTGLVASFEGDAALEDWAFTYDQALATQVFLLFGDTKSAENVLSFYDARAARENGAFLNVYDATHGQAFENVVHVGPNVWIGIAALQYEHNVKDGRFLPLAKSVADWVISQQDAEGGLKGGPTVTWYSIEHNLDAYAFFSMLYQETRDERYQQARGRILSWIKKYAYSVKEKKMNRGKGDATIATDTFSWAVAAMGPETLKAIGFDAEEIMEFAEKHCGVEVDYPGPGGKTMKVKGFDFSKSENVGRGGVISTEWTAQVIVTYQILGDYFKALGDPDKAALYADKSNFYLNELQKLIITSPSRTGQGRGCLPYASIDNVDTGHGWRTPRGMRTGSVAATAYGIFAWVGYNPFDLLKKTSGLWDNVR